MPWRSLCVVETRSDGRYEIVGRDRLPEEGVAERLRRETTMVAGGEDDLQLGATRFELSRQRESIHGARHEHVGEDQIDPPGLDVPGTKRGARVVRVDDAVSLVFEHALRQRPDGRVVLHEE